MTNHVSIPYQFDVTNTTNVVNMIIDKLIELAEDNGVTLPPEVQPFSRIDLAEIADAMKTVSTWQAMIVNKIGLSRNLTPKVYEQCDYNSIISYAAYYGDRMNAIIDAVETQDPPENYGEHYVKHY
jgi:hypothetical protein